jgi:hypothetical protein
MRYLVSKPFATENTEDTENLFQIVLVSILPYLAASYPNEVKIILAQDNLKKHNPALFYEAFPAAKPFTLAQRFSLKKTPPCLL